MDNLNVNRENFEMGGGGARPIKYLPMVMPGSRSYWSPIDEYDPSAKPAIIRFGGGGHGLTGVY